MADQTIDAECLYKRFAKTSEYSSHAFINEKIGNTLLDRLEFVNLQPSNVLYAGARSKKLALRLQAKYKNAKLVLLDNNPYLHAQLFKYNFFTKPLACCSDYSSHPFKANSFDFIFAHLTLNEVSNI